MKDVIRPALACLLFALTLCAATSSPGRFLRFERLIPEWDGKSVFDISSIFQDKEGFLWFGTGTGLAKFDGYHFTFYAPTSTERDFSGGWTVYPALESLGGNIWVGTAGRGLLRFDKGTETFVQYRHDPSNPASLGGDIVLAIQEDRGGDLWIGTRLDGLVRFDRKTETFRRFRLEPDAEVIWDLLLDSRGYLWIGTEDEGLFRLDPATEEVANFRFIFDNPGSLGSNTVWSLFEDHEGTIWAGTKGGGLNRYLPKEGRFLRFIGNERFPRDLARKTIMAIAEDESGRIWIGTQSNGLRIWDPRTGAYEVFGHNPQDPETLSDDGVTSILRDRSGIMWIGTVRGGINKCLADRAKFEQHKRNPDDPLSISHADVRALWVDKSGCLWVGSAAGLDRIDEKKGTITRFADHPTSRFGAGGSGIQSIWEDARGRMWLGTEDAGLACLDVGTGVVARYRSDGRNPNSLSNDRVYAIVAERRATDVFWIATHNGLNRFDMQTRRWTRFHSDPADPSSLTSNIVTAILEDASGSLWAGTSWGLNKWDPETKKFDHFVADIRKPAGASLNDNVVNCLHEDAAGRFWVGTAKGLNRLDRTLGEWKSYGLSEGLAGDIVAGILEDDAGDLWLSTNRGLSRFRPETGEVRNYGLPDGIQGQAFNPRACFRGEDGRMFFGGVNGFSEFDPRNVRDNSFIPPVVWTAIRKNNERFSVAEFDSEGRRLLIVKPGDLMTFEFAALDFAHPASNRFTYRLEPRDENWIPLGTANTVSFTGLKRGNYRLRVKGANPDGVWNEEGAAVGFKIATPFWETPGFAVLVAGLAAFGILALIRTQRKIKVLSLNQEADLEVLSRRFELSPREREILPLVLRGMSNKDLAKRLYISGSTVRNHIHNIYQKLGASNRLELLNVVKREISKKI
jgi:ligand-binding sensor domain-containing protein/DNA-binding CsgD family transcriptional regulator